MHWIFIILIYTAFHYWSELFKVKSFKFLHEQVKKKKTLQPADHIYTDPSVFCSLIKKLRRHISLLLLRKPSDEKRKHNFVSKSKKKQRHVHIFWMYQNESYCEYGYACPFKTPVMLCISDILLPHDVHLKTNLMWLSVDQITEHLDWWELCWTVLRALCPGPSMWRFNTLILGVWVRFSVGPCPHVSLHRSKRGGGLYLLRFLNRHGRSIRWWCRSHTETCFCGG